MSIIRRNVCQHKRGLNITHHSRAGMGYDRINRILFTTCFFLIGIFLFSQTPYVLCWSLISNVVYMCVGGRGGGKGLVTVINAVIFAFLFTFDILLSFKRHCSPKMTLFLSAVLATLLLVGGRGTPLDDYVNKPDPSYKYDVLHSERGTNYTTYYLNMTSQTWKPSMSSSKYFFSIYHELFSCIVMEYYIKLW